MSRFDHSDLDGQLLQLLQLLVAVFEEDAVTPAALRLGTTQSAVSHLLDRLRAIVGDPLFVRAGRGIAATARAETLVVQAPRLLDEMRRFTTLAAFDPAGIALRRTGFADALRRLEFGACMRS